MVRVCRVIGIYGSLSYYQSRKDDTAVIDGLNELAGQLPSRGFDKCYDIIRLEVKDWGRRRVLRVYLEIKLKLRRKHKRRCRPG
jgi:putative transposase